MKRPLGIVALVYGCGLLLGDFWRLPLILLFGFSLVIAIGAVFVAKARAVLLWPLLLVTGWTNLAWRTAALSPHDLQRVLTANTPEEVIVRGTLRDEPAERVHSETAGKATRSLAQLDVRAMRRGPCWRPAFGTVLVRTQGALPGRFYAGADVVVSGVLGAPRKPVARELFDYGAWLRRQDIYFELNTTAADWQLVSRESKPPLSHRFQEWAQGTLMRGLPEEDTAVRLLWAMALGCRSSLTQETYDPFIQSGTMHIFAISGLHIALLADILVRLLRAVQVSRPRCGWLVIPLIWFYAGATGWQPSAVRSTIMMTVIIGGWSLRKPSDLLNSLSVAALILLLWDPQQLFQAGFQLSFCVVLSLALFVPRWTSWLDRWLQPDRLLVPERVPRWRRWLLRPARYLGMSLAVSLAAWLGSWPLTACYFHLLSPVTLVANLVMVPLSSAALAASLGSLLCGGWFPFVTELFNHSGWFWMRLMMEFSRHAVEWPGAFFYVRSPTAAGFGLYYGMLLALANWAVLSMSRRFCAVGVLAVLAITCVGQWWVSRGEVRVTVLPLNGGSAVFVDGPGARNDLLVDCGNTNGVEFVTKPFLRACGVNRIPHLVLTHGDARQVGGAELVRSFVRVERVCTSRVRFRSPVYRRLVKRLSETPQQWRLLNRGDRVGDWLVLHPEDGDRFSQADDGALVLRGWVHGTRILLVSDLGKPGQNALLNRERGLEAEIVIGGLPQRTEPASEAFLGAARPQLLVVADSELPATRRAGAALKERLQGLGIPVLYTRREGALTFKLRAGRWAVCGASGLRIRSEDIRPDSQKRAAIANQAW